MARAPPKGCKADGRGDAGRQSVLVGEEDLERAGLKILWRETSDPRWHVLDFAASPVKRS